MTAIGRRDLLRSAGAAAVVATAAGTSLLDGFPAYATPKERVPTEREWRQFGKTVAGRLFLPGEPQFPDLAEPQNKVYAGVVPAAVLEVQNPDDVAKAIRVVR